MAYKAEDFINARENIKTNDVIKRAHKFWIDYTLLRSGLNNLINNGDEFMRNKTVWRNIKHHHGTGRFTLCNGVIKGYCYDFSKAVSFEVA